MQGQKTAPPSRTEHSKSRPPLANATIFGVALMTFWGMLTSPVPLLVLFCGLCLVTIILLLWTSNEPPILLLPAMFQWSEVAILPLSTSWLGVPLAELAQYGTDLNKSASYGLLGVLALSIGMKVGMGGQTSGSVSFSERIRQEAEKWPQAQVLFICGTIIVAGYVLAAASVVAGPLREPLNQASNIKYLGLFFLTYWCLYRQRAIGILLLVIVFEVIFGMTGFFAEFKNSILTFFIAAVFARPKVTPINIISVGAAACLILSIGIFWSSVKPDYRSFVNKGTGAQIVDVPIDQRVDFLANAALSMDNDKIADGFQRLITRHGYIEYLGLVMENIPRSMPHQNGSITASVFGHITVPRVLWKDKPVLMNDTEVMSKYSGLPMTWNSDTSISIGYLGELYADFGYYGGLIGAAVIGFAVGFVYRNISRSKQGSALMNAGLCLMIALPIAYFGTAYVKLVGSFVLTAAIVFLLQRILFPMLIRYPFLKAQPQGHQPRSPQKLRRI